MTKKYTSKVYPRFIEGFNYKTSLSTTQKRVSSNKSLLLLAILPVTTDADLEFLSTASTLWP